MDSARARRRRIEEVCDAALDREAGERAAFVSAACGHDDELRQEVEALLAHAQTAEGFLAAPMGAVAAHVLGEATGALLVGQQIGSYQILSRLGAGGMGEVYRARDTKLGRDVAIKVLPNVFVSDPDRLARFEREARLLATLNHPHIGAIYGLDDTDGVRALVLELVEGPTLADRLSAGPLPVQEAVTIARQIAEALDAAHEKGIIHRDLKPANIKVTSDGTVKVLDFGLAKAMEPAGAASGNVSQALTVNMPATGTGMILGTAAYMSPEQARGKPVDKRSDIWAFGCVLYEMLAGQRAFAGETISDTIAAILEHEPDWRALPATTPTNGRRVLQRCLEKDPKRRLRDIGDARVELDDAMASPRHFTEPRQALPGWTWTVASALVVLGLGLGWTITHLRQPAAEMRTLRLTVNPPAGTEFRPDSGGAISPDGRLLAFVTGSPGGVKLWIRPLNSLTARELPGTDAAAFPFWSPDSQRIAYTQGAPPNVFSANANGTGTEERLIETRDTLVMEDWSPNGQFLLYLVFSNDISSTAQADLWVLPMAADHEPAPFLTTPFREGPSQSSPDGQWIAYSSDESGQNEVYVQGFPPSGSKWQVSSRGGDWVRWRKDGRELFYVAPDRTVMSVVVLPALRSLELGTPSALFALPATFDLNNAYPYDVMPDGQRFLALAPATDAEEPPMTVIVNWRADLSSGQK